MERGDLASLVGALPGASKFTTGPLLVALGALRGCSWGLLGRVGRHRRTRKPRKLTTACFVVMPQGGFKFTLNRSQKRCRRPPGTQEHPKSEPRAPQEHPRKPKGATGGQQENQHKMSTPPNRSTRPKSGPPDEYKKAQGSAQESPGALQEPPKNTPRAPSTQPVASVTQPVTNTQPCPAGRKPRLSLPH